MNKTFQVFLIILITVGMAGPAFARLGGKTTGKIQSKPKTLNSSSTITGPSARTVGRSGTATGQNGTLTHSGSSYGPKGNTATSTQGQISTGNGMVQSSGTMTGPNNQQVQRQGSTGKTEEGVVH